MSNNSTSWYRRSLWHYKGVREYTKAGYTLASNSFAEKDLDVDCSGKHYMITGANSGLGLATALEIAKRGGELHLVCRNAKSMKDARSQIITTTGNDRISQHQVNLAKPREVRRWAEEFVKTNKPIDVLINNAGCMVHERTLDGDGIETSFAVNTLSIHIMVTTLMPTIEKSSDPRVIIVSSGGMLTIKLDSVDLSFETMNPFNGVLAYNQTKRQQVVMNFSYAQRYPKVHFSCMHPGWADTPAVRNSIPEFYENKDTLRTPLQGADTIVWLAVSGAAKKHSSGLFFQDRVPTVTHLPMAWTKASIEAEQLLMQSLDQMVDKFSIIDDYFKISNVGSDILNSDSFLGQEDQKEETQPPSPQTAKLSVTTLNSNDVVSKQTSIDHPARTATSRTTSSTSEDDAIIQAVETILYNDAKKTNNNKTENMVLEDETFNNVTNQQPLSAETFLASQEKISFPNLTQVSTDNSSVKTESLINGSTSDRRKEAAIDDLLNDAFQTEASFHNINLHELK